MEMRVMLQEKYPTLKALEQAIAEHGNQRKLAETLGVSQSTLWVHKRGLETGKKYVSSRSAGCQYTESELSERVRELYGSGKSEIKVYRLTDKYRPNQLGTEGLIPIRTDEEATVISRWARTQKKVRA